MDDKPEQKPITLRVNDPEITGLGMAHGEVVVIDGQFTVADEETAEKWRGHPAVVKE